MIYGVVRTYYFNSIHFIYLNIKYLLGSSRKSWLWENESILSQSNNIRQSRVRSTNSFSCNESLIHSNKLNSTFPRCTISSNKTPNISDDETTNFYNDEDDDAFFSKKTSPRRKIQVFNRFNKNQKSILYSDKYALIINRLNEYFLFKLKVFMS
jgi:hypothetical protein